ncbi:hypothetical protein [Vibrio sonorensis]|nr:hypothetical protein [Vibrio sonorensis]
MDFSIFLFCSVALGLGAKSMFDVVCRCIFAGGVFAGFMQIGVFA